MALDINIIRQINDILESAKRKGFSTDTGESDKPTYCGQCLSSDDEALKGYFYPS